MEELGPVIFIIITPARMYSIVVPRRASDMDENEEKSRRDTKYENGNGKDVGIANILTVLKKRRKKKIMIEQVL